MRGASVWLWPLALALALALATRLGVSFDGLYGQDAFAYFRYARALGPHLLHGRPLPPLYWPIGYPATIAPLLPLFAGSPAAGQTVNSVACAAAASATALLTHRLQREESPRTAAASALAAGVAVALSGATLRSSQVVMADALALGLSALALLCAVRYAQRDRGAWLIGCAFCWAWATSARWLAGLLVLPIGAFLLVHARAMRGRTAGVGPRRWPWIVAATLASLAILGPVLAIAHSVPQSLERHEWLVAWNPRNAVGRDFHTPDGHAIYRLPVLLFYGVRLGWPDYFFPVLFAFALFGAWTLVRDRRWATGTLLLGWPAAAVLFLSGIPYENPRFLLPTLPALGALCGIGFGAARGCCSRERTRVLLAAVLAISVASGLGFGLREHLRLVARKNDDRALVTWTVKRLTPDAALLIVGPSLAFEYYASIPALHLFSASPSDVDALLAARRPVFLLANLHEIETQWPGLAPERLFVALRRRPGLALVGTHSSYSLFRVGLATDPAPNSP